MSSRSLARPRNKMTSQSVSWTASQRFVDGPSCTGAAAAGPGAGTAGTAGTAAGAATGTAGATAAATVAATATGAAIAAVTATAAARRRATVSPVLAPNTRRWLVSITFRYVTHTQRAWRTSIGLAHTDGRYSDRRSSCPDCGIYSQAEAGVATEAGTVVAGTAAARGAARTPRRGAARRRRVPGSTCLWRASHLRPTRG